MQFTRTVETAALDRVLEDIDQESGKTLKRPEFERLQADIFSGQIKTVVCWRLDRLSRRLKDGVVLLADWCERGLKIVTLISESAPTATWGE